MIVDALRYALVSRLHLAIFEDPVMTSENRLRSAKSGICAMDIDSYIYHSVFFTTNESNLPKNLSQSSSGRE